MEADENEHAEGAEELTAGDAERDAAMEEQRAGSTAEGLHPGGDHGAGSPAEGVQPGGTEDTDMEVRGDKREAETGRMEDEPMSKRVHTIGALHVCVAADWEEQLEFDGQLHGDPGWQEGLFGELSGAPLDPDKVKAGKALELEKMKVHDMLDLVTAADAKKDPEAKIIGSRWVVDNKMDLVRARLVAQEVAKDKRNDTYAGTPGLKAIKTILSLAASKASAGRRQVALYDISVAFFHARLKEHERHIYIRLPPDAGPPGYLGWLKGAMNGTRIASKAWQDRIEEVLTP
eukprot:6322680-Amphidinium_carterae.1